MTEQNNAKILEFQGISGLPAEKAQKFLKAANWNVEVRLFMFFSLF